MGVQVQWDNIDKTIIRYDFKGIWTWNDFYAAHKQAQELGATVPHHIDLILDMRAVSRLPGNALLHIKQYADKQPRNVGLAICITSDHFVQTIYSMDTPAHHRTEQSFRFAASLDEAYRLINQRRGRKADRRQDD
jgi:hypothetical protein